MIVNDVYEFKLDPDHHPSSIMDLELYSFTIDVDEYGMIVQEFFQLAQSVRWTDLAPDDHLRMSRAGDCRNPRLPGFFYR
jgi:hypothetical protein